MPSRWFRVLLLAYPPSLRRAYGAEMSDAVAEAWRARTSFMSRLRLAGELVADSAASWRSRRRPPMRHVSADLRDAFRLFRRSPLFGVGAVLTLALGVGATTAILTLADATLVHPLPVPGADRIVQATFSWSYPDFTDLAAESRALTDVVAWSNGQYAVERAGETTQVLGTAVSGRYFDLAGQRAVAGRLINAADSTPGAPLVAVVSERLWDRVFRRDAGLIGTLVNVNRRPVTIVGVAPAAFRGLSLQFAPEMFVPVGRVPELSTGFLADPQLLANRGRVWMTVAGRLRPGVRAHEVDDDARRVYYSRRQAASKDTTEWFTAMLPQALGVRTAADLRTFMTILVGASVLTMLLTCATVANLLLVRAERRRHELAVRAALGAGRRRISRLLLVESLAIGAAGAAAGVAVALLTLRLLGSYSLPGQIVIADLHLTLNLQLLLVCAALGLLTTIVFGAGPALLFANVDVATALRAGARSTSRQPVRSLLVAVQVALCVLLLGGTMAFGRALEHALSFDFGFNVTDTSITATNPALARYSPGQTASLHQQALDRLRAMPGVQAASWVLLRPLSGALSIEPALVGDPPPANAPKSVQANVITDGYFETLQIPIIAGRTLTRADLTAPASVVVVSESLAKLFWPGRDALGKRLRLMDRDDSTSPGSEVIGVVGDIHRTVGGPSVPMLYVPANQVPPGFSPDYLIVRSTTDAAAALAEIRGVLRAIDPLVPVTTSATMRAHVAGPLMAHRLGLVLFLMFAVLAIVLTAFGIYAVVATAVAQRTREIGIRIALGAKSPRVLAMVARQGVRPVLAGMTAGAAAVAFSARLIKSFMFSLPPVNAWTLAAIAVALGAIALIAMLVPARRALAVDPTVTLRAD